MNWRYTDSSLRVAMRVNPDGSQESKSASLIDEPIDPPIPPEVTQDDLDNEAARSYAKLTALKRMSPLQVQTWVQANVTNLAQAQDAIATLAIAVSILARRI